MNQKKISLCIYQFVTDVEMIGEYALCLLKRYCMYLYHEGEILVLKHGIRVLVHLRPYSQIRLWVVSLLDKWNIKVFHL